MLHKLQELGHEEQPSLEESPVGVSPPFDTSSFLSPGAVAVNGIAPSLESSLDTRHRRNAGRKNMQKNVPPQLEILWMNRVAGVEALV